MSGHPRDHFPASRFAPLAPGDRFDPPWRAVRCPQCGMWGIPHDCRGAVARHMAPVRPPGAWPRMVQGLYPWARRNWGLSIGLALVAMVLLAGSASRARQEIRDRQEAVARTLRADVDDVLSEIGGAVRIDEVRVAPLVNAVACYSSSRVVTFSSKVDWSRQLSLPVAGHECVHALFDQRNLRPWSGDPASHIVEEMAAEVLGAVLAGRVLARRGGDGAALTRSVIAQFRSRCSDDDWDATGSHLQWLGSDVDPAARDSSITHFGSRWMVDEMQSLATTSEVQTAAAAIVARFRLGSPGGPCLARGCLGPP